MLAEEVTKMNDYGYFVDIDIGTIVTQPEIKNKIPTCKEKPINVAYPVTTKQGMFCFNTICCMAVSILYIKLWLLSPKKNNHMD